MTKKEAIDLFGSVSELCSAYGCTKQNVSQWPETLPRSVADRVLGAATRSGIDIPDSLLISMGNTAA